MEQRQKETAGFGQRDDGRCDCGVLEVVEEKVRLGDTLGRFRRRWRGSLEDRSSQAAHRNAGLLMHPTGMSPDDLYASEQ